MITMNKFGEQTDMAKAHADIQSKDHNSDNMLELWEVTTPYTSYYPPLPPTTPINCPVGFHPNPTTSTEPCCTRCVQASTAPIHPSPQPPSTPYDEEMKALYFSIKDYKPPSTGPDQHWKDTVTKLFHYYDENKDGKIDAQEVVSTLNKFGEHIDMVKAHEGIKYSDKNGDMMLELWELLEGPNHQPTDNSNNAGGLA